MSHISLKSVCRTYESENFSLKVLDDADLDIPKSAFAVICGPSGSGKSTLLNMIGALDRPDTGSIEISGIDIGALPQRKLAKFRNETIGFVFQSFHLLPVLTAAENVAWPLFFKGVRRRERMRIAREKLALVGLSEHANKVPGRLSGGQRQRVAIARALVCDPAVILADEPTANLDRKTAQDIIDLMQDLNTRHGVTFLCATHDPLVVDHARQVITLVDGKLHMQTTTQLTEVADHA